MKFSKYALAPMLLLCLSSSMSIFSEITIGNSTVSCSLFSNQNYREYNSDLNPGNMFEIVEGYYGIQEYTFSYRWSGDKLSFVLNDFGSSHADKNPDLENHVSEMYVSTAIPGGFFDIGKKRINQSLSYFKSPINFVLDQNNRYDLRFSEGRVMANLDFFTDFGFFGFSYIPRLRFSDDLAQYVSSPQDEQYLFRYDVTLSSYETGIAITHDDVWRVGSHISTALGDYFEVHCEYVFHQEKNSTDFDVVGGFASDTIIAKDYRSEGILGITVNIKECTGIFEYYYNQSGNNPEEWKNIRHQYKDIANSDSSNPLYYYNLGLAYQSVCSNSFSANSQHYFMFRLSNPASDDYHLALNTVVNMQDFSGYVMPSYRYEGWKNIALEAVFSASFGQDYTEFKLLGETWSLALNLELWL